MTIILTGANGFLGKEIASHFSNDEVIRLGRTAGDILISLEKEIPVLPACELVIHAAGKAHVVPKTEFEKQAFYEVNVKGAAHLLQALEQSPYLPKYFVFISSVSVYGADAGHLIDENHPLNASDPYGKSKIDAERIITDWCNRNNVVCTILRLPLLAGKNPPGNLQSMIKALSKGYYFNVGRGTARKSMIMINDVASFIEKIFPIGGTYNLTDGHHPSFSELAALISKQINRRRPLTLPYGLAKLLAIAGDIVGSKAPINSSKLAKMTNSLTFSDAKARNATDWKSQRVIEVFVV